MIELLIKRYFRSSGDVFQNIHHLYFDVKFIGNAIRAKGVLWPIIKEMKFVQSDFDQDLYYSKIDDFRIYVKYTGNDILYFIRTQYNMEFEAEQIPASLKEKILKSFYDEGFIINDNNEYKGLREYEYYDSVKFLTRDQHMIKDILE